MVFKLVKMKIVTETEIIIEKFEASYMVKALLETINNKGLIFNQPHESKLKIDLNNNNIIQHNYIRDIEERERTNSPGH
jgi:hypothetical protein